MKIRETWIKLLHSAATGTKKTRMLLTPVGLLVFFAFSALFVLAAILIDELLGLPGPLPEVARIPLGVSTVAVGIIITGWSAFHFLKVRGTPVPFNPPPKLVSTGPYRYARNPMLTGVFLFLFGIGLGLNSISLVLIFTPLYVLMNYWELKNIEEPELVKRLGDQYIDYRRRTPMFIPRRKPKGEPETPNQPFQADRDPRERGSRPLNSSR
jgi:protein-S-isoprenylcysteine O-methyltransferase Ste14